MKRIYRIWPAFVALAMLLVPELVMAAGGKAEMLIVVADNRVVESGWFKFLDRCVQHGPVHVRPVLYTLYRFSGCLPGVHY